MLEHVTSNNFRSLQIHIITDIINAIFIIVIIVVITKLICNND